MFSLLSAFSISTRSSRFFLFSMFRMTLSANCRSVSLLEEEGSSIENLMRAHLALAQFADKKFKQVLSKVTILENCALL